MHPCGPRAPTAQRTSGTANGLHSGLKIPSSTRPLSKAGLPWGGMLGVCILLSISVNIYSLTLNKYQYSLIEELTSPLVETDVASDMPSARRLNSTESDSLAVREFKRVQSRRLSGDCDGPVKERHAHPHDALLYLFNALAIGAAVMQLSARYPILQQTIVLFVIGFIASLIMKGLKMTEKFGVWGDSYLMWMEIDPHLLLFTLLPALLAGDAMTIDTSVAKRVGKQCLFLAGPGVCIGSFATATFLHFYIGWESKDSFMLSLCAGSILCATDPVAVVALLKELGASPMLTVQIQGESLLNDGTAIVVYLISYDMLMGQDYDWIGIITFLMEKALMAFALGLFIGYFFFAWIRAVANKLEHSSSMIQIVLTLSCAYVSFIIVEGVLHLSGVLATVASSLVLAHHMWPYVCSEESMHHVWHTFESLGNIIVFFLAGSITGYTVLDIDPVDFLHLVVIYIVLLIIRGSMLFACRPVLRLLHADRLPVSWQDATLMTWGGLRGAVGLALAIQVNNGLAPCLGAPTTTACVKGVPQITEKDGQRLLFFVSGIAFLTTLVNATTAPKLVEKLKITALPAARQTLLKMFHSQLIIWSEDKNNPPEVTASLKHMLYEAAEHIAHTAVSDDGPKAVRAYSGDVGHGHGDGHGSGHGHGHEDQSAALKPKNADKQAPDANDKHQENKDLIAELSKVKAKFESLADKNDLKLLSGDLPDNQLGKVDDMIELIQDEFVDIGMAKVVNQCFLTLVYNNYWKLIEDGKLRPGGAESDVLLTSIRISLSPYRSDLTDFDYVALRCIDKENTAEDVVAASGGVMAESTTGDSSGCIGELVASTRFNIAIAIAILANSIVVCIEELGRTEANKDHMGWIVADAVFTSIFIVEWFLKNISLKCAYYKDNWNRFDFLLVVIGIVGFIFNLTTMGAEESEDSSGSQTSRLVKLARVLRTLRFLRIFRLFNARLGRDKFVSLDLAKHMTKITTMNCFIWAHLTAQNQLLTYFGGNGKLDEVDESEIARCILQSQVSTYRAMIAAAENQQMIGIDILLELSSVRQRKEITEGLRAFVDKAHADGAISATEAHAILHPLHHEIGSCMKAINDTAEGMVSKESLAKIEGTVLLEDRMAALAEATRPEASPAKEPEEAASASAIAKSPEDAPAPPVVESQESPKASPAQPEVEAPEQPASEAVVVQAPIGATQES